MIKSTTVKWYLPILVDKQCDYFFYCMAESLAAEGVWYSSGIAGCQVVIEFGEHLFFAACRQGNLNAVEAMLKVDPELAVQRFKSGLNQKMMTPLMIAAAGGYTETVRLLLVYIGKQNPEAVNWALPDGETALHIACSQNYEEVVRLLLEFDNTDVSLMGKRTTETRLPALCIACAQGYVQVVKVFLEFTDKVNISGDNHAMALLLAAETGHTPVVEALLNDGRINMCGEVGHSALFKAVTNGHFETVVAMLKTTIASGQKWEEEAIKKAYDGALKLEGTIQEGIITELNDYSEMHYGKTVCGY